MKNYIEQAMRTNSNIVGKHGRNSIDFAHACLGLVTELDELMDANSDTNYREETGDMCWYIALACQAVDIDWPDAVKTIKPQTLAQIIAHLTDLSKKWFAYGKRPETGVVELLLGMVLHELSNIDDAQERNIAKLKARYPDKFEASQALTRDLDAELKALKGKDA